MFVIYCFTVFVSLISTSSSICEPNPEQIHLSLSGNSSELMITWITLCPSLNTQVKYGIGNTRIRVKGYSTKTEKENVHYVHRVLLKRLKPDKRYIYRCGNDLNWSQLYSFKTLKEAENWSARLAVFGDLGQPKKHSILSLINDVQAHKYHALYHIGAFGNESGLINWKKEHEFFREIEPITARVAYLTVPVNPIQIHNSSNYNKRFSMINSADNKINNYYYSTNIARAHIISFTTEYYYSNQENKNEILAQIEWLKNDLIEANRPENRKKRPWIITLAHRPMVCSGLFDDCTSINLRIRNAFEKLFYEHGVDLEMWGGGHSYERFFPFYNFRILNGSFKEPYNNPKAPVHILTAFKDRRIKAEYHRFSDPGLRVKKMIAISINENGYTRVTIVNKTHLRIEHIIPSRNKVVDDIMIVKDLHNSYASDTCDTSQHSSRTLLIFVVIFYLIFSIS